MSLAARMHARLEVHEEIGMQGCRDHTWPQELGQPVQWMRIFLGKSNCCSSFSTTAIARFLVSITASPQNCTVPKTHTTISYCINWLLSQKATARPRL